MISLLGVCHCVSSGLSLYFRQSICSKWSND